MTLFLMLLNIILAIEPSMDYDKTPKDFKLNYKEVKIKTSDSLELNAWIIYENESFSDIMIMSNSDFGNMSFFLPYAKYISQNLKKAVILYDYRGYGKSSKYTHSKFALSNINFVTDLKAVIKYAQTEYSHAKVSLYGFSMGASVSLLASKDENIDGLFLDSPMIDPDDVIARISNKNVFLNEKEKFNLTNYADQIRAKEIFIIHGKNDRVIDLNIITKFYSQIVIKKNILILENNNHGDLGNLYPDLYLTYLKTFLIN